MVKKLQIELRTSGKVTQQFSIDNLHDYSLDITIESSCTEINKDGEPFPQDTRMAFSINGETVSFSGEQALEVIEKLEGVFLTFKENLKKDKLFVESLKKRGKSDGKD